MKQKSPVSATSATSAKTKDGVEIFYKDWGKGQPIVFGAGHIGAEAITSQPSGQQES